MAITPPTFVAQQTTTWTTTTTDPLTTSTISAATGDVAVAFGASESADGINRQTLSGTGVTLSLLQDSFTTLLCEVDLYSGTVSSGGNVSATLTSDTGYQRGVTLLTLSGSNGVGASNKASATANGQISLTTTQDNSAVLVFAADWNAVDGASRTWLTVNSYTPSAGNGYEKVYNFSSTHYTVYGALYPDVGAAGAKTFGLSAPGSLNANVLVVEITGTDTTTATLSLPNLHIEQRIMTGLF